MERNYKNLCRKHGCHAKVFCKYKTSLCERIGNPDMMVVFTHTASHKMVQTALGSVGNNALAVRSHTSSMNSLQKIPEENVGKILQSGAMPCGKPQGIILCEGDESRPHLLFLHAREALTTAHHLPKHAAARREAHDFNRA